MDSFFEDGVIECRCGCGFIVKRPALEARLYVAQLHAGFPFKINSWCRCFNHNVAVGGKDDSEHRTGEAVDITAENSGERFRILKGLLLAGFKRVGVYNGYFHAGIKASKSQEVVWLSL
jgi:hypothetical protein